jgi:hypothetical protein
MKPAPYAMAALATLALHVPAASAKDPPGFDPAGTAALKDVPVEVVVANDRLRFQMTSQTVSVSAFPSGSGLSTGAAIGAGVAGSLIAGLIINASIEAAAKDQARAGATIVDAAGCDLPHADALAAAGEQAVRDTAWGASATVHRHVLAQGQNIDSVVPKDTPRLSIVLSYSLAPDFSALMTTAEVQAYAAAIPAAPSAWQTEPAWSDHIVYVSDTIDVPNKSQAVIDQAVADENARYAQSGVDTLIAKANKFDDTLARRKAVEIMKDHEQALRDARARDWTFDETRHERARLWTVDGCAPLRSALESNDAGIRQLLAQTFSGQLPAADPHAQAIALVMARAEPRGDRHVVGFGRPEPMYVSIRQGDRVFVGYRYAWYDDRAEKQKH